MIPHDNSRAARLDRLCQELLGWLATLAILAVFYLALLFGPAQ